MSKRETKLFSIYLNGGKELFDSYEEIEKVTNSLKTKLEYLRKNKDNWYINAFLGMSNLNIRYGSLKYNNDKKCGRKNMVIVPKKFVKDKSICFEPWHLHILIEANPGETVAKEIVSYMNKKLRGNLARVKKVDRNFFMYVMKQCSKIRYVKEDRQFSPVRYRFKDIYEVNFQPHTKARKERARKFIEKSLENRLGIPNVNNGIKHNNSSINKNSSNYVLLNN